MLDLSGVITAIQRNTRPMSVGTARALYGYGDQAIYGAIAIGDSFNLPGPGARARVAARLHAISIEESADEGAEYMEPDAQALRDAVAQCLAEYDAAVAGANQDRAQLEQLYVDTAANAKALPSAVVKGAAAVVKEEAADLAHNLGLPSVETLEIGLLVALAVGGFLLYEYWES